jgi:hypothetical protein
MHSYPSNRGIRFNDCLFSEPTPLPGWTPPRFAGLFAILVHDPNWAPKPFQPLCFGELRNNARQPLLYTDFARLVATAGSRTLLVSVLPLPFSTTTQRWALRDELIWAYNPTCQISGANATAPDLAHRMNELERQNRDQSAQVLLLLSNLNRMFEPQTVPARRPIGFLPESTPAADSPQPANS